MDIFEPCYAFQDLAFVKASGFYPYFRTLSASEGPVVTADGRRVVMLGSNNYLGLTHHPDVMRAAHEAIDQYGTGCTGSRFLNGNLELHETLEREIADFVGKEAAIVFSSGFLANAGTLSLLGTGDSRVIFSASENHASLIDGSRAARGARIRLFESPADLEHQLARHEDWSHALVVTDAVFSMTGRVADLAALVELKRRYHFRLYVDDAHGFGVLGPGGRGTAAGQQVTGEADLIFATFSKALGSLGGFVAGDRVVIDYLRHKVRTFIFSAALPPASAAAALASLRVLQREPALLVSLHDNAAFFRQGVEAIGYHTMGSTTPIIPLLVGSESLAFRMAVEALDLGVFATPAVFPAVPLGQALIRTSVTPAHTREHLQRGLDAFATLAERYRIPKVEDGVLPEAREMDFSYLMTEGLGLKA